MAASKAAADDADKKPADTKATKPAKAPATGPKIMDVAHPGKTAATPTSRPVIVPSRSMVNADPMVAAAEYSEDQTNQRPTLSTPTLNRQGRAIKPLTDDTSESSEAAGQADAAAVEPNPEPLDITAGVSTEETPTETEEDKTEAAQATDESETPQPEEVAKNPADVAKESDTPAEEPASTAEEPVAEKKLAHKVSIKPVSKDLKAQTASDEDEPADDESSVDAVEDEDKDIAETEEVLKAKTAEQIRAEELEAMIQKGTYAVPINHVAKKRALVTLTVLIVLVMLVAIGDLLLDMGIIKASGIPHTNFFSS